MVLSNGQRIVWGCLPAIAVGPRVGLAFGLGRPLFSVERRLSAAFQVTWPVVGRDLIADVRLTLPDQVLEFLRRMPVFRFGDRREYSLRLTSSWSISGIQPDAMLQEFRIIKLRSPSHYGSSTGCSNQKPFRNANRLATRSIFGDQVRCLANSGVGERQGARSKEGPDEAKPGRIEKYRAQARRVAVSPDRRTV